MRPTRRLVLTVFAALALTAGACGGDDAGSSDSTATTVSEPRITINSPADGAHIKGNVVTLAITAFNISIVAADGDTTGKTGHFHVFVDKDPVAPGAVIDKAPGIIHTVDDPILVPGLSVGPHTLTVVFGDGSHTRLGNASATIDVIVDGPSVDATAPATLKAGEPLSIDVTTAGVGIVAADGDASGATGHLHAFVDVTPVAPGEAIPVGNPAIIHSATSPIVVTGLTPGEHTIWVVVGDGTHAAFKDSVRDKVVVTVS